MLVHCGIFQSVVKSFNSILLQLRSGEGCSKTSSTLSCWLNNELSPSFLLWHSKWSLNLYVSAKYICSFVLCTNCTFQNLPKNKTATWINFTLHVVVLGLIALHAITQEQFFLVLSRPWAVILFYKSQRYNPFLNKDEIIFTLVGSFINLWTNMLIFKGGF